MLTFRRIILFATICGLIFGIISCQTKDDQIHEVFKEGLEYISNRDNYQFHSMLTAYAVYFDGFTKHRYIVTFNDPLLKAYGTDPFGEITYRIAILNQEPYIVYQHGDNFYKTYQVNAQTMSSIDFNHPIFFLLENTNKEIVTEQDGLYKFSLTYQEMVTSHPNLLSYIDEGMSTEITSNEDANLSSVIFDILVIMNDTNPKSFQTISIDFKQYATLKYPLSTLLKDRYEQARLTYEFSYENYTKDITSDTTFLSDDHHNYGRDDLTEITLGIAMIADLQYMVDLDFFKLTIQETKTYQFQFSGIQNVIFYLRDSENLTNQIRVELGDIELEQGTYYFYVMNYADTVGEVSFSFSET